MSQQPAASLCSFRPARVSGPLTGAIVLVLGLGCARGTSGVASPGAEGASLLSPGPRTRDAAEAPSSGVAPLPPLTPQEAALAPMLQREVTELVAIGERSSADGWLVAEATDHLAQRLEARGLLVRRRGFTFGDEVAQNLEVELGGGRRGDEVVIGFATFASPSGSPGANDSASGAAAIVALAELLAHTPLPRKLRLVLTSTAGPSAAPEAQGAFAYAQGLADDNQAGRRVAAVVELRGLGAYSELAGSQQSPDALAALGLAELGPGNFIALVSTPDSAELASAAGTVFEQASLPAKSWVLPPTEPFLQRAELRHFMGAGYPALLVTDTLQLRSADAGTARDTPDHLDYERMSRAVVAAGRLLVALAGAPGALDTSAASHQSSPGSQ